LVPAEELKSFYNAFLEVDFAETKTQRTVYSIMDWLGDVGGLYDALRLLASLVLIIFQSKLFQIKLVTSIFSKQTEEQFDSSIVPETHAEKAEQAVKTRKKWSFNWKAWLE